jgi:hypothetical protein
MYPTWTVKRALFLGGATLLALAAILAWTHRGAPSSLAYGNPVPVNPPVNSYGEPQTAEPVRGTPVPSYGEPQSPAGVTAVPVVRRYHRYYRSRLYRRRHRVVVVRRRPWLRSAAIVAGSAGAGAAIGALAGGGKGAGIGAIAGGTGGLIYDRLTHKKKRVVRR